MIIQEWRDKLHNRSILYENDDFLETNEMDQMYKDGFIIIYGYDNWASKIEGRYCFFNNVSKLLLSKKSCYKSNCSDKNCPYELKIQEKYAEVYQDYYVNSEYVWTFTTNIIHETFDILDEGKKFCKAIIIDTKDLPEV